LEHREKWNTEEQQDLPLNIVGLLAPNIGYADLPSFHLKTAIGCESLCTA